MTKSKYRGHDIFCINDEWFYFDTKESISNNINRSCGYCGKPNTEEDHDFCISNLPGVMNACCGHGNNNEAYIQFPDRSSIHGVDAVKIINQLKGDK
jgi:hypothetical protein